MGFKGDDDAGAVNIPGLLYGVHLGHQELLNRVIKQAKDIDGTSVVITFEPHPLKLLRPEKAPRLLTSLHEKIEIFQSLGIQVVLCIDFTLEFSRQSADAFIRTLLGEKIGARAVLIGPNYIFGKNREGNIDLLNERGKVFGFEVGVMGPVEIEGHRNS